MSDKSIALILSMLIVIGVATGFFTSANPQSKDIIHEVSIGIAVSGFFYILVVQFPFSQRRRRLRRNLQRQYDVFRLNCIHEFLIANGESQGHYSDQQARRELLQKDEFHRFFCEILINEDQTRWNILMQCLEDENCGTHKDILHELEVLREEITYVLNNIDIYDDEAWKQLHHLSHVLLRLKDIDPRPDYRNEDMRRLESILFQMFTGWNFTSGFEERDIIESVIKRI